ncbi:endonuclease/exonuclease/phosphatase family protein [Candidatus Protofrankia californiensis]|uniref:endonuclease/exonuclease/phosphatase family protein n=1 Tax=Candidatus Protofrankia californiensis TaxID=1839754 RepID=UPI00104109ED
MLLGTWNLENLFRPGEGFGPADTAAYQGKLAALATTIRTAGVDVLGVQEVGDPDALADLAGALDDEWTVVLSELFEPAHPIRVGVLSRLPVQPAADTADFPAGLLPVQVGDHGKTTRRMGRGALAVTLTPGGTPLTVVVCHLKSKLLSFPSPHGTTRFDTRDDDERARYATYALHRRAAEAATVRALATRLLADEGRTRRLVVVGDLNDEPQAATTQILAGPPGSEIGTGGFDRPDHGDGQRLRNLAAKIPVERRYSRIYQGRKELIDHILVSHALLHAVGQVDALVDRPLPSLGDNPASRRDARDSDHAPILAHLTL